MNTLENEKVYQKSPQPSFDKGGRRGDFGVSPVSKGKEFYSNLNLSGNRDS
jgi:hypothetical protein